MIYSEISNVIEARNHFRCIVAPTWTGSYLIKQYGAHYRKYLRMLSKKIFKTTSDWVGDTVWGSPIVSLAPPAIQSLE